MKKLLIVVDMQNDFVYGSLGTAQARAIVEPMKKFIDSWDGEIVYTQDTHPKNYLCLQEGRRLPVEHCIACTDGWKIVDRIYKENAPILYKKTFGVSSAALNNLLDDQEYDGEFDEIHFIGVCTGICVLANAIIAKTLRPEARIVIHKDLCACVTEESHQNALKAMELLQMDIV